MRRLLIAPGLIARPSAQRIGGRVNRRQSDHLGRETRITLNQLGLRGTLRHELGDHVNGHAGAAKDRVAAHDFGIADDKTSGPAQFAQRRRQLTAWLAQIDLDEAALKGHDIAHGFREREDLIPGLECITEIGFGAVDAA